MYLRGVIGKAMAAAICFIALHLALSPACGAGGCTDYRRHFHWAGKAYTTGLATGLFVTRTHAFVTVYGAQHNGLEVMDLADPANPKPVGSVATPGAANKVVVEGALAYVADSQAGLQIIDVADPSHPAVIGSVATGSNAYDVAVKGVHAYVAANVAGLQIVDVSDPAQPAVIGGLSFSPYTCHAVAVGDFLVYAIAQNAALQASALLLVEVADPAAPRVVGTAHLVGAAYGVTVAGDLAYVNGSGGLRIVDVSDPHAPVIIGTADSSPLGLQTALSGAIAFLSNSYDGLQAVDVADPTRPKVLFVQPMPGATFEAAVLDHYLYAADYQYASYRTGLHVFDLADMGPAERTSLLELPGVQRAVARDGGWAYIAGGGGLLVVDVTDPASPVAAGEGIAPGFPNDVAVGGGLACLASGAAGLQIFSIANPPAPQYVAGVAISGYARTVALRGAMVYVGTQYGLHAVDVSQPGQPILLGAVIDGAIRDVELSGALGCVARCTAQAHELLVVDFSSPALPLPLGCIDLPSLINGVAIAGDRAYALSYHGGLHIIDLTRPQSPSLLGGVLLPNIPLAVAAVAGTVYVADQEAGVLVVDVTNARAPKVLGHLQTPGQAFGIAMAGSHFLATDASHGLVSAPVQCPVLTALPGVTSNAFDLAIRPNPFNARTSIRLTLAGDSRLSIGVFDLAGRLVARLANGDFSAGLHELTWSGLDDRGRPAPSGIYLVRAAGGGRTCGRPVALVK